jgi:hypothetical protein
VKKQMANYIEFIVDKQIIRRFDNEAVVQDSQNYLNAMFTFTEESEGWEGAITAVFKGADGQAFNVLLDSEGMCLVPWEVLTGNYFDVSLFCGDLITANVVRVYTIESGYEIGQESREPTPDVYNQIIERIDNINAFAVSYENADLGVENVGDALDVLAQGGGGGGGGTTPNIHMTAEVDATTGTPDVEVTKTGTLTNPIFNLAFTGLKGETGATGPQGIQGETGATGPKGDTGEQGPKGDTGSQGPKGDTGATPIISASATVSNTTGTPSVNVSKSGTDEAPSFAFAFSNLKGAKGDTGEQGPTGATGPQGPQGIQGPTGPQGPKGDAGADGSVVTVTQTLSSGTKIAEVSVDGTVTNLYAPSGSGGATSLSGLSDVELGQSIDDWQALRYDSTSGKWKNAPISPKVESRVESSATITLEPNKLYMWPLALTELDISLNVNYNSSFAEEFHFMFSSGSTPTELSLPSHVITPDDFSIEANKVYEISIMQTLLLYNSWTLPTE